MIIYGDVMMRAIEADDLAFLAECRNAPETWKYLGNIDFANEERQRAWLHSSSLDKTKAYYVLCKLDGTRIGFVRMDEIDFVNRSIRVGGDIHPAHRKLGYGTAMYRLILKYTFDYLNMHRVWLMLIGYNQVAFSLYKKMGFRVEGKQREGIYRDGEYHDYFLMSILDREYRILEKNV